jgi:type VI secretion system secreted protein Hcp
MYPRVRGPQLESDFWMWWKRILCSAYLQCLVTFLLLCNLGVVTGRCSDIYIKIGSISGGSTAAGHAGWSDVLAMSHGIARVLPSNATHNEISFTKRLDKSTPLLYGQANDGAANSSVQIDFIRSEPPTILFYNVTLNNAYVSSVQTSASSEVPTENVTLAYGKISWTYTQVNSQGQGLPTYTATWNLNNNTGGLNTTNLDTDLDGMDNAYELANGLNPNVNDANGDLDGDGLTNYQEYLAGTLPNNFNSVFRVSRANLTNGLVRVTWTSVAAKTYTVHAANNVNGPYTPVRNVTSAGNVETFTDFTRSSASQYYRVSTP